LKWIKSASKNSKRYAKSLSSYLEEEQFPNCEMGLAGFEPATNWLRASCSTMLRRAIALELQAQSNNSLHYFTIKNLLLIFANLN